MHTEHSYDEATRWMSAAPHLNAEFADNAISEYIREPLRAHAPSPGIEAASVLQEAISASRRRQIRDALLISLMGLVVLLSPSLMIMWWGVALIWRKLGPKRRQLDSRLANFPRTQLKWFLGALAALIGIRLAQTRDTSTSHVSDSSFWIDRSSSSMPSDINSSHWLWATTPLSLALIALFVLLADRMVVWFLMTHHFRRGSFVPVNKYLNTGPGHFLRALGVGKFAERLKHIADTPEPNVIVYRGATPFVGAGETIEPWSIAVTLEPSEEEAEPSWQFTPSGPIRLDVSKMYNHIRKDLLQLHQRSSLSPDNRLGDLRQADQIVVTAASLVLHVVDDETGKKILPSHRNAPEQCVPHGVMDQLIQHPREWLRYFSCFRVESWDRNLIASLYVHLGLDDHNLYLECVPCILHPVDFRYRTFDALSPYSTKPPLMDALGSWLVLPDTVLLRAKHFLRRLGFNQQDRRLTANRYGAHRSLREMAAGTGYDDYLQQSDVARYLKVMERRLIRATGSFMESNGYSVVAFMKQAEARQQTINISDSTISDSNIGSRSSRIAKGLR